MKCPFIIKVCTKCDRLLVANAMNFHKSKTGEYGLCSRCKECRNEENRNISKINKRLKNKENPFDNIDPNKVWNHCPFVIQVCTLCGEILVANEMNFEKNRTGRYNLTGRCKKCLSKKRKEYKSEHREEIREKSKQYREERKEELNEKSKKHYHDNKEYYKNFHQKYYQDNKEEIKEKSKQYVENNKEKIKERNKKYRKNNPHIEFNHHVKRRQLEENQGNGISKEQWFEMMEFFDWHCAYSDIQLDKNNRSIDHIISLNNEGLNEPWNCVPMYMPYNSSKRDRDMITWYKQQKFFDIDRLMKIYEWQEYAFEKWGMTNGEEN